MDPFDRIGQRLTDFTSIYDDDGPSSTVQESRPMFNDGGRLGFFKGKLVTKGPNKGKVGVPFFVDGKGTAHFPDFKTANKAIADRALETQGKYKKANKILNDPKLKKEFIEFANDPKNLLNDVYEKFNIGGDELNESGLKDIIGRDFVKQKGRLRKKTVQNMLLLHNNKLSKNYLQKGLLIPEDIITKLGLNASEAATATTRLSQMYGGKDFYIKDLKNIKQNKKASTKLFDAMNKFAFGNPYRARLYDISLELIDEQLGNQKGTFASLKKKASYILKKNKIKGFDINEIAGVSGTARSGAGEFSQFIDVMDSNLNQKQMASFQAAFSNARQNIANNPNNFAAESKRINKLASRFEKEYGVKLPRIRDVGDVEKYYSANRLKQLNDQGLDIKKASKNVGYTIQMPKGAQTITEFIDKPDLTRLAVIGCGRKAAFDGGRINFNEGQNVVACAAKGVEKLQGDPGKLTPGDQANVRALAKSGKALKFLKGVLGPGAILGEVIFEGGAAANKFMDQGMPIKQALGESYINKYLLGPKSQIDVEAERAKEFAKGEDFAMAERGRRMAPFMAQSKAADERRLKNRMQQMEEVYPTVAVPQIDLALQDAGLTQQETGMSYPELQDYIKRQSQMQAIADAGGVANMAGGGIAKMAGDRSGPPPESGPNSQGLQGLFNRVKKI